MNVQTEKILKYLPYRLSENIGDYLTKYPGVSESVTEIRLHASAPASITVNGVNIIDICGVYRCTPDEIHSTLIKLCEDSVHTYENTIKEGYVTLDGGYRIGVCGSANTVDEKVNGIYNISSLSIRIPHIVVGCSRGLLPLILSNGKIRSALIYSPPGVGKTTLIRDLALTLSSKKSPLRVSVVDSRREICIGDAFRDCIVDVLTSYPKAKAIEIATRTMSPQLIICDEIGTYDEAAAILSAQSGGVPLIATAHADCLSALKRRPNIGLLTDNGVFDICIGLRRDAGGCGFTFDAEELK